MKIPKLINNLFSVNKTCLLFFHNKHAFGRKLQTNLNIQCGFVCMHRYLIAVLHVSWSIGCIYLSVYTYSVSVVMIVAGKN